MVSADIALTRLFVAGQHHQDLIAMPRYWPTPPAVIVRRLHRLSYQGHISVARTLEVMNHAESLCRTGSWYRCTSRAADLRPPLNLYFLGIAVSDGFIEFVAPALDKLEGSVLNDSLSASYKGYLVSTACIYGSMHRHEVFPSGRMADMVALLLGKWTDIGHWGFHYPGDESEDDMVPCTAMMALCRFAFSANPSDVLCTSLEQMLRHGTGGSLEDVTTFMLYEEKLLGEESDAESDLDTDEGTGSDADSDTDVYSLRMHCFKREALLSARSYILVEANMSYILSLYQMIQEKGDVPVEATRSLSAEAARHSVTKTVKVLYLRLDAFRGNLASEGDCIGPMTLTSDDDSSYLLESLSNISVFPGSERHLVIPGLGQKMREVAMRGKPCETLELDRDLERSGHVVAKEHVKNWPPKPYTF